MAIDLTSIRLDTSRASCVALQGLGDEHTKCESMGYLPLEGRKDAGD
jgi:hypothetical protein